MFEQIYIDTEEKLLDLIQDITISRECAIDTETTGLNTWLGDKAFMATFAPNEQRAYCVMDEAEYPDWAKECTRRVLETMANSKLNFIFHNAIFDLHMTRAWTGWRPADGYTSLTLNDTMWGFRNLYPGQPAGLKIASKMYVDPDFDVDGPQKLVHQWLSDNSIKEKIAGKTVIKQPTWDKIPREILLPYAVQDAWMTLVDYHGLMRDIAAYERHPRFQKSTRRVPTLMEVYRADVDVLKVVIEIECAGFHVDEVALDDGVARGEQQVALLMEQWQKFAPEISAFSPTSAKQLQKVIYENLGEPVVHRTKTGQPSVDETALRDMKNREVGDLLMQLRGWNKHNEKARELQMYLYDDSRVHSSFKADGARTGRFSSSGPALQNLTRPNPDVPFSMVRDYFRPPSGRDWLFMDFSQIELRLAAEYMHDPAMLDAFRNGVDFHKLTAARTYGIPLEEVTKAQRALSKILNFSILYGAGMRRITESLRYGAAGTDPLTVDEAEAALKLFQGDEYARPEEDGALYEMLAAELLGAYHRENPLVRVFMNRASASSQEHGHILTAFGNIVNIPKDKGHIAANAIIQGSAAGMMKETLIRTASLLEESFCPKHGWTMWDEVRIVTTIHDELCVELPSGYAEECARLMEPVMRRWPQFEVPIEVEFALVENGSSWAYKKDMKLHA